jgi:hypothetical protein
MDFDLHLRILAAGGTVAYGKGIVANFRKHPFAKTAGAANALTFVREYVRSMDAAAETERVKPNRGPLAPLVVSALISALSRMSSQQLCDALRTVPELGYRTFVCGSASFALRRFLLGRRDELP